MFPQESRQTRFLETINPVAVLIAFQFLLVLRTTIEAIAPSIFLYWDILLPFTVYFGQRRHFLEGLVLTFFCAHLYSLSSTAPMGVYVAHALLVYVVVRGISHVFYAQSLGAILGLLGFVVVLSRIIAIPVAAYFGHSWAQSWWGHFGVGLLLNVFVGLLVYLSLGLLDRMTFKVAPERIKLSESPI